MQQNLHLMHFEIKNCWLQLRSMGLVFLSSFQSSYDNTVLDSEPFKNYIIIIRFFECPVHIFVNRDDEMFLILSSKNLWILFLWSFTFPPKHVKGCNALRGCCFETLQGLGKAFGMERCHPRPKFKHLFSKTVLFS